MIKRQKVSIAALLLVAVFSSGTQAASSSCVPIDVSAPAYPVNPGDNAVEAAKQAADYAKATGDETQAARIAAEVALQISASPADMALIIAEVARALRLSSREVDELVDQSSLMTCSDSGEIRNLVRRTLSALMGSKMPRSFEHDSPYWDFPHGPDSDNPNLTRGAVPATPGLPVSPN